ncbi:DivIVA domain-containing protein [Cyclobacterium jeungdonense]|uniref:DivIVA domain-containing protein n=1 Tax=Cyclobacterium jeungdonense TaxID=708087 RepID=A0ABT8C531_9BACT|nr:DivIVA domain-containing protein [Cyclobacterium jeungdonense]MDN3686851.1 DivIVA domain-containing protein [Cyclobacterium jeungdonense]
MKITPLDIRQKTFEKNFRGYDKEEVAAFMNYLSQEWEKLIEEKNALKVKYEQAEKEASKLREVEQSLFKTLKTAEDTGASIIEQANKTAELILKEAQMNADALNAESKNKARNVVDQAESQAKNIIEDLKEDVQLLVDNYEKLQSQRDYLLKNLKKTAAETLENVKTVQEDFSEIDAGAHTRMVKDLQRKESYYSSLSRETKRASPSDAEEENPSSTYSWQQPVRKDARREELDPPEDQNTNNSAEKPMDAHSETPNQQEDSVQEKNEPEGKSEKKQSGSFFDQFD